MSDDTEQTLPAPVNGVGARRRTRLEPMLTVLAHPDPARVGDRMGLGAAARVSRGEGGFASPRGGPARPLETRWLSRTPLSWDARPRGAIRLRYAPEKTQLTSGGRPVPAEVCFAPGDLEDGVSLVVNDAVALLLHRATDGPDFIPAAPALVGDSDPLRRLQRDLAAASLSSMPVLLRGATGTGKELVAGALHRLGPRAERPFVSINLGAIPPELAAAELFGFEAGAFSGAGEPHPGAFRAAAGGVLFLDEVGEAPPRIQVALLRALESGEIQPLGCGRTQRVDVRVVAATDSDLEAAASRGTFRHALLERLGVLELHLPPLRTRRDDIGRLLFYFLRHALGADPVGLLHPADATHTQWPPASLVAELAAYDWPRNVRQIRNIAYEMATLSGRRPFVPGAKLAALLAQSGAGEAAASAERGPPTRDELRALLRANRFGVAPTARALGLSQGAMYNLLRRHGVAIARDLDRAAFEAAFARAGGDLHAMSEALEISVRALTLRRRQLGFG